MSDYTERYYSNDFDSRIDYQDLTLGIHDYTLTLILRIFLRQLNPPPGQTQFTANDASGDSAPAVAWQAAEWDNFKDQFKRQTYRAWNNAFTLTPPASFKGFVDPNGVRRTVRCFIELDLRSEAAGSEPVHYRERGPTGGSCHGRSGDD